MANIKQVGYYPDEVQRIALTTVHIVYGNEWYVEVGYSKDSVAYMSHELKKVFINQDFMKFFPELWEVLPWQDFLKCLILHEGAHILYTRRLDPNYIMPGIPSEYVEVARYFVHQFINAAEDCYIEKHQATRFGHVVAHTYKVSRELSYGPAQCAKHDDEFGTRPILDWFIFYMLYLGYNPWYMFKNNLMPADFIRRYQNTIILNDDNKRADLEVQLAEEAFKAILEQAEDDELNPPPPPRGGGNGPTDPNDPPEDGGDGDPNTPPQDGGDGDPSNPPEDGGDGEPSTPPQDGGDPAKPGAKLKPSQRKAVAKRIKELLDELPNIKEFSPAEGEGSGNESSLNEGDEVKTFFESTEAFNARSKLLPMPKHTEHYHLINEEFSLGLIKQMRKVMQVNRPVYVQGLTRGKVDGSRLIHSVSSTKIFKQKRNAAPQHSICCTILIDVSDSAGRIGYPHHCLNSEAKAMTGMAKVFETFKIPFAVYLFGEQVYNMKGFSDPYNVDRNPLLSKGIYFHRDSTVVGPALIEAGVLLRHRKEDVKMCIVLTDGYPHDGATVTKQIEKLKDAGVLVVTIIFGRESDRPDFEQYYGTDILLFADSTAFDAGFATVFTQLISDNLYGLGKKSKKRR